MQPQPPHPQPAPPHRRAPRRGYGVTVLASSLAGGLFLLITLVLVTIALLTLTVLLMALMTGGDELVPEEVPVVVWVALAVTGASLLLSIALDAVACAQSVRRLDGRHGDRAVPVIVLVAVLLATVLPLLAAALLMIGFLVPSEAMVSALSVVLTVLLGVAAPSARIAQLVAGILVLRSGEPRPRTVAPLP